MWSFPVIAVFVKVATLCNGSVNNTWTPGQAMTGGYKYMNINTWKRNRIQLTKSTLIKVRHDDDTKRDNNKNKNLVLYILLRNANN